MVRFISVRDVLRTLQFVTQYRSLVSIFRSPVVTVAALRLDMTWTSSIRVEERIVCLVVSGVFIPYRPRR